MFAGGEGAHRGVIEIESTSPIRAGGAEPDQARKIPRIAQPGVRTQAPFVREVAEKAISPILECGVHERTYLAAVRPSQRVSAKVTNSPMRERNSVLIPGWNLSASPAPMARSPSAPFGPSGVTAAEPMPAASGPKR